MNANLIEKIIRMYNEDCPALEQENPLLNKDVAKLLASSYIKLLNNSEITTELRELLLQSIRTLCQSYQSGHLCIDETDILQHCYEEVLKERDTNAVDYGKVLDIFLIRHMKEINIKPIYSPFVKPDVIQAMSNLQGSKKLVENVILSDIIYWNVNDDNNSQYEDILKQMWNVNTLTKNKSHPDDISIKLKPNIERTLLKYCEENLNYVLIDIDWFREKTELSNLVQLCGVSRECFQICCSILNSIFIMKNFNHRLQKFIKSFITNVKLNCLVEHFSDLYPSSLRHIVVLLDVEKSLIPEDTMKSYTETAIQSLHKVHDECENDAVLLLSHFDDPWFEHYYNDKLSQVQ